MKLTKMVYAIEVAGRTLTVHYYTSKYLITRLTGALVLVKIDKYTSKIPETTSMDEPTTRHA
jgi:hypothetical protein